MCFSLASWSLEGVSWLDHWMIRDARYLTWLKESLAAAYQWELKPPLTLAMPGGWFLECNGSCRHQTWLIQTPPYTLRLFLVWSLLLSVMQLSGVHADVQLGSDDGEAACSQSSAVCTCQLHTCSSTGGEVSLPSHFLAVGASRASMIIR